MATVLKIKIGNAERTYRFSNEEDAKEAEGMAEDQRKFNADAVATAMDEKQNLTAQIADLQKQLAEHDATLKQAKEELEKLMDENHQEAMAAEMQEQGDDEDEIANAETSEAADGGGQDDEKAKKDKDDFLNAIRKRANGSKANMAQRRENCVRQVMKMRGAEIPATWDGKAFDAAFETIAMGARMQNAKRTQYLKQAPARVLNGVLTPGKIDSKGQDTRSRMLNAMKTVRGEKK